MAGRKGKKGYSVYILPVLFCGLLIALALIRNGRAEQPVKAMLQESEPLTLNGQAVENYLFSAGYTLYGETLLDESGKEAGSLAVTGGADGGVEGMTLSFPLPTYYETGDGSGLLAGLKALHDEGAQRGEDMFLALFDAIAATDGRVATRRDSAAEKLHTTMDTGKAASQSANSWRFSFSLEPGAVEGRVTVLFDKVK